MPLAWIRSLLLQPGYGRTQLVKAVRQVMAGQLGILLCLWISALIWPVYWSLLVLGSVAGIAYLLTLLLEGVQRG